MVGEEVAGVWEEESDGDEVGVDDVGGVDDGTLT